ncbi:MAG: potassium transporter TrkA, partial [Planctomycetota bacterium]
MIAEVCLAAGLGVLLGKVIALISRFPIGATLKGLLLLACNYLAFTGSSFLGHWTEQSSMLEIFLEPLLVCMVAGFVVANFSSSRIEFRQVIDLVGPTVYITFFTLTGASLAFNTLVYTWRIALLLFILRLITIFVGALAGGMAAGDPWRINRISWMAFVTQAGIGLGLVREVSVEFPFWGETFTAMMIAVIVLNQLVGPPLFKWALHLAGESHGRAGRHDLRGTPVVFIFGFEGQSRALARQLHDHGWRIKMITLATEPIEQVPQKGIEVASVADLTAASLESAGAAEALAFI